MFMEQEGLKKSFNNILDRPLSLINNPDFIPVLVALENIYQSHVMSFFHFIATVNYRNSLGTRVGPQRYGQKKLVIFSYSRR